MEQKVSNKTNWFENFASRATKATGSSTAFIIACLLIIVWGVSGYMFDFSERWLLLAHTTTSIITFLMVFLIQKTVNKDSVTIQVKLNELVASNSEASNRIVSIEDLSEEELHRLNEYYTRLAELTRNEKNPKVSRSIEDTAIAHDEKKTIEKKIDDITK